MPEKEKVRKFFDDYVDGFDALYNENKPARSLHRFLRASLFQRFELTREEAKRFKPGFSAIDIGTGSGRYLALLAPYAGELTAIDLSDPMLTRARLRAEMEGYADKLTLLNGDFLDLKLKQSYDLVLALGYFDYITDAKPHLLKMMSICRGKLLVTFPKRWHWLTPQRKIRYWLAGCPLHFYSISDVKELVGEKTWKQVKLQDIGRDYFFRYSLYIK